MQIFNPPWSGRRQLQSRGQRPSRLMLLSLVMVVSMRGFARGQDAPPTSADGLTVTQVSQLKQWMLDDGDYEAWALIVHLNLANAWTSELVGGFGLKVTSSLIGLSVTVKDPR